MVIERLVGLYVTDEEMYQHYRDVMYPLLKQYGGDFGYDFKVSEVLKSKVDQPINRVFTIYFKNEESLTNFFADEHYLDVRKKYYEPAVSATTIISKYQR